MQRRYLARREEELNALRGALESDLEALRVAGHRWKGTAPSYGFDVLGDLGAALEQAASQGDREQAARLLDEVARTLSALGA